MLKRKIWVIGILALAVQMTAAEARADNWFDFGFLWPQPHRGRAYYADPYYMPSRPRGNFYSDPGPAFDDSYYDPTIDGPPPVRKKPVKHKVVKAKPAVKTPATTAAATTAVTASKTASAEPAQTVGEVDPGKTTSASGTVAPATTASTTKAASAANAISCDKAQKVVAGFGFSDVKPAACSGAIYAFNAVRDGKPYAIKLNSASGELTEVKKAQP